MLGSRFALGIPALVICVACGGENGTEEEVGADPAAASGAKLDLLAGGLGGPGTTDGIGPNARLKYPESVVADGRGNVLVADGRGVRKINVATGEVSTVAGGAALGHADGVGSAASFDHPIGLALDGNTLFVADSGDSSIRKVDLASAQVTTLVAGASESPGSVRPMTVHGLATHGGSLYVASPDENTVRRIVLATGASSTIAGADANLRAPRGVAADGAGNLFIADSGNHTVRSLSLATGVIKTIAGAAGVAGSADGVGDAARFDEPRSIVSDGAGALYVTTKDHVVRKIIVATGLVTTVAGASGEEGAADGSGTSARFRVPRGIAAANGDVFVADTANNTVRKIAGSGAVTTLAGRPAAPGAVDGAGQAARFDTPMGIAVDENDDVFVADRMNLRIRQVSASSGAVRTLAGGAGGGATSTAPYDGVGEGARFFSPMGVASDRRGHLFVADGSNIRKIDVATRKVTTIAYLLRDHNLSVFGIATDGERVFVHDRRQVYAMPAAGGAPVVIAGGGFGSADGVGTSAQFLRIDSIARDASGNLWVVDGGEYRSVRKIAPATGAVTTVKKLPPDPWDGNVRPEYRGMAVDAAGAVFVSGSKDIFKLVPSTDTVSRFIGNGTQAGVKLGGLPAGLAKPRGLAFTRSGALVIADTAENALLVVR
jgi:sugar lactone lactonase YvrE